eukprot:5425979-Prorocentrum_lima.AAC.1
MDLSKITEAVADIERTLPQPPLADATGAAREKPITPTRADVDMADAIGAASLHTAAHAAPATVLADVIDAARTPPVAGKGAMPSTQFFDLTVGDKE